MDSGPETLTATNPTLVVGRAPGKGDRGKRDSLFCSVIRKTKRVKTKLPVSQSERNCYFGTDLDEQKGWACGLTWWTNPGDRVDPLDFLQSPKKKN